MLSPTADAARTEAPSDEARRAAPRVTRALRHHAFWLVLVYLGLILLMARPYA